MSRRSVVSVSHSAASRRPSRVHDSRSRSSDENDLVYLSHPHSSDGRSFLESLTSSDDWDALAEEDDIGPSDSASRPRPAASRHTSRHSASRAPSHVSERPDLPRQTSSGPRSVIEEVRIRESSRRPDNLESREHTGARPIRVEYHRHHSHRSHPPRERTPSEDSRDSLSDASHEEGDFEHRHEDHYQRPLAHSPPPFHHRPSYPPSMSSAHGPYNPFDPHMIHPVSLVHRRGPHEFQDYPGYPPFPGPPPSHTPHPNPFLPHDVGHYGHHGPPYSHRDPRPMGPSRHSSYVSGGSYPGQELVHPSYFGHPSPPYGVPPPPSMFYPPYGYPPHIPPAHAHQPPLSPTAAEPPAAREPPKPDPRDEELQEIRRKLKRIDDENMAAEKRRYEQMEVENKRLELEKAAWEAEIAKREADKALKAEISAAEKKAKDAADAAAAEKAAKLKEEHEKAIEAAKKRTEEAEAAKKKLEEDAKRNAPDPDSGKAPILFKDALGRKFTIPYSVGKSWKGMHAIIRQAFHHTNLERPVMDGHYDLVGPAGDIILPQVWDSIIKPEWEVSMTMWPEPEPHEIVAFEDLIIDGSPRRRKSAKVKGKDDKRKARVSRILDKAPMPPPVDRHGGPPLPPFGRHGVPPVPPFGRHVSAPEGIEIVQPVSQRRKPVKANTKAKKVPPVLAFFAGAR
ncbi:hypothetical protein MBLNU457_g2974t1 [Dothideomycetes sp. NU457]